MKANYTTPDTKAFSIVCENIIASSNNGEKGTLVCSEFCKHWHFCLDRKPDRLCPDKEYQNMEAPDKVYMELKRR